MARAAGLEATRVEVLEHEGYAHLLIRRFDIEDGERIHQHTFGGLVHVDYNDRGASSYEEYLRTVFRLGMTYGPLEQAYRRMVFNVLAVNQDDHVKNLSFHMRPDGEWSLAPAYDLTFARGVDWTSEHQMRVRDKTAGIRESDLLAVAREFGVKKPERILEETRSAVAGWEGYAQDFAVPPSTVTHVRKALDERVRSLEV